MIPVLPPSAIAQELTACTVLGGCTGVVRAVFPVRGRAAWVPDFLWVGTVLTLLQSVLEKRLAWKQPKQKPAQKQLEKESACYVHHQ